MLNKPQGTAPGMDALGDVSIFSRSEANYQLRCLNFNGDGDSKSFSSVYTLITKSSSRDVLVTCKNVWETGYVNDEKRLKG